ncbi:peptidoglycan/xylan/chitin deacetylase (PgdA/CDA1 family) [Pontibacter ummariensis]|uniref:Peptidoglycan/xylan/chitin deacetylase, PgdA/CDA1 family n=1 Tax=Pontibacter ummariensis TaxID=1610492 RepID=A0A239KRF0_9BACT|nr:polysaccharide deacetylase family protein [Pontibacter ummariensis]PRY05357.1 peptidoglycan/xylan/chitin deacetylase (PgdA/CDA1 family) [Pontibacter ummariensis]SNT19794.1 Peptidoglycan/xylan/chitin deacetylase, PgdA/CDA1 family [Pontibacter ummariensis]
MIRFYKTPWLLKKLLPGYTWEREGGGKTLYLTFDDGPIPEVTPWVLEQLEKYGAKATFFCVGDNVRKHPEVAQQVLDRGHQLANHTYHHLKGWETPLQAYVENAQLCQQELEQLPVQGRKKLFRPPYGRITKAQAASLRDSYELIMWDVLTNDYDNSLAPEKCLRKSIQATQDGSIILFHDSLKAQRNMRFALPRYLEHFNSRGYAFKTL